VVEENKLQLKKTLHPDPDPTTSEFTTTSVVIGYSLLSKKK
jgi:hypothetical protein